MHSTAGANQPVALTHDSAAVPADLKAIPQWVGWKYSRRLDRNGEYKWAKVPVDPTTGDNASVTDPATWASYDAALEAAQRLKLSGVGFVLTPEAGIIGGDLDHCVNAETGELEPAARAILESLNTYSESSPSRTGARFLIRGEAPEWIERGKRRGEIELYRAARFVTITGGRFPFGPPAIETRPRELAAFCDRWLTKPEPARGTVSGTSRDGLDDDELMRRIRASKQGPKFARLFDHGEIGDHSGDFSAATMALCCVLAGWSGDAAQIDRLFRRSGLMRPKWDDKRGNSTWGARQIAAALDYISWRYEPSRDGETESNEPAPFADLAPLDSWPRPDFPLDCLPGPVATFVRAVTDELQVPAALPAFMALATLSAAVGKRVRVRPRPGWQEPLNLYMVTAADPGERKSEAVKRCAAPLRDLEQEEIGDARTAIAVSESDKRTLDLALKKAEQRVANSEGSERAEAEAAKLTIVNQLAVFKLKTIPRRLTDDCTPEMLSALLAANDERMAVLSAEGGVFDIMGGRFSKDGKSPNLTLYLSAHAGEPVTVDRLGREGEMLSAPALTLGVAVQPDVLRSLADKPGFRGRGLLGRFAYAIPHSRVGSRTLKEASDEAISAAWRDLVRGLATEPLAKEEGDALVFDSEARALFERFWQRVEDRTRPGAELEHVKDWAGKLAGLTARLAALLHLAREHDRKPCRLTIGSETVRNAVTIAEEFLIPHALAAFGEMGAGDGLTAARHLWAVLADWDGDTFSKRDLHQRVRGRFPRAGALDAPLALLEEHGYVRALPADAETKGRAGRPPGPRYEINTAARAQNPQNTQNLRSLAGFEYFEDFVPKATDDSETVEYIFHNGPEAA